MTDGALASPGTYAQVRVREPIGDRTFGETPTMGGQGADNVPAADIVVPGAAPGAAVQVERYKGVWTVRPIRDARVRINGRMLSAPRDLRRNDVLAIGDAQIIVTDLSRTLLRLDVCHLAGNATISPAATVSSIEHVDGGEDLLIQPPRVATAEEQVEKERAAAASAARIRTSRPPRGRTFWIPVATAATALLVMVGAISQFNSVSLDVEPEDAGVHVPGTLVAFHAHRRLWLLAGEHTVRAEHDGYTPAQLNIAVKANVPASVRLRLAKLPGTLRVDTAGVAALVSIDGVEVGRAPGAIRMPAGTHTITLRAPRYVDYIASIDIQGAGASQDLKAVLQPSWGTIQITAIPTGSRIAVDGVASGVAPAVVDAPSGVRQIRISAPGLKTWESSVVLEAGEALNVGPITLGQPDAQLSVTSVPSGAEVTVGGTLRGRTPLEVDLPAGFQHELVVNLPGYADWTRAVFADSGKKVSINAKLEWAGARVTIQGEPDGAQLFIDGADRGRTPQTLQLSATEHRIEVRKEGWVTYTGSLTPLKGLDRTLDYRLVSQDRSFALSQTASTVYAQNGYRLRLVPGGTFPMGSERREQGRRPNKGLRQITLLRPLYFGVTEVTNEQYRRFHPAHTSGFIDRHSMDLDDQPVTQVSWNDAAEYCNWLSGRDNLPVAYAKKNDHYVLERPVTIGYRLPTEAEWEYAVRYAAPVGKLEPTPLGLHDLAGNVSEWTGDYYFSFVEPAPVTDPLGPADGTLHVIRGANWKSAVVTDLRLAARDGADGASSTIGFRVVRYAE